MVTVPVYQQDQTLRPNIRQGINVQASADDFGAAIGRGMQQAAQGGMQLADSITQVNELKASLTAKDSLTAFERDKMELDYGQNGFMTTQGRNAVDGRAKYNEALEDLRKRHGANLTPAAASKYDQASTAAVTQGMRSGIIHAAQGQKEWAASSSTARMELLKDQALVGYDKPDEINKSLHLGYEEIAEQANLMGWDQSVIDYKRKEFSSQVHSNVAIALASKPNGARSALTYIEKNGAGMDPKTKLDIETKLRPFAVDEEALSVVNGIVSEGRKVSEIEGDIVAEVAGVAPSGGPTRSKAFLHSRSAHKDRPGDTANLDNSFADNLAALIQDAPAGIREGLGLFSAFRTGAEQRAAYAAAAPGMAAKPGGSQHEVGRAVDLSYNGRSLRHAPPEVTAWLHENANNYGLYFPLMNSQRAKFGMGAIAEGKQENWHIEPIGTRGTGVAGMRGSTVVPARDGVSARASMPSYGDAMARIDKITDPEVRASAIKQLNAQFEIRSKAESANADAAKTQIWTQVLQGVPMSAIPLDLKVAAGREAVSGFMDFEAKAGNVTTNPIAYSKLNEMAATDPIGFAKIDMTASEIINSLSREDWKALSNKKTSILGDERKATEEGAVYTQAYKVAEEFYGAAGIITGNSADAQSEDNRMRQMRLNDEMRVETQQFMELNKGKKPGYEELRAMAAMLTMKAIAAEKRTNPVTGWFDSDGLDDVWEGRLFERRSAPGGAETRIVAEFKDIPADWVSSITVALTKRNGAPPTKAQIEQEWTKIATEIVGTN